ncbi:Fe-S-cluster-containing hydrogenase subunit [Desulfitobacterium dichloroeliminans LMG P-21439]|uniref:Fe-S-cluster-containing hydrogenase subunit n=1 Tax=Desulfitobacterium dichloroeliminans (strain LMG P-21439 / DCA1) TaxID=871963 RepID=L0F5Q5_DESDL|nr:4Fe-4S dicluster domain-containing protein [Desulfitobacterium dichloroeliminans]AGA69154.1 Fe-S-cluster-containing hydrogenase subunit [Desulfitobacterium dichloroeliminans LMG P-21439]
MSVKLGMLIDQDRCIGCWTCSVICKMENNIGLGNWWNRILSNGTDEYGTTPATGLDGQPTLYYQPTACMHCENAPCVRACPTGATYKDENGITRQDYKKCIGCRTCMAACPYNARVFNWGTPEHVPAFDDDHIGDARVPSRPKGVVEKCTFCQEKVAQGESPACVTGCTANARVFGDLNDPNSEISRLIRERGAKPLLEDIGTKPSVYYVPPRRKLKKPAFEGSGYYGE